jgi:hypothetical protein
VKEMHGTKEKAAPGFEGQFVQLGRHLTGFLHENSLVVVNDFGMISVEVFL